MKRTHILLSFLFFCAWAMAQSVTVQVPAQVACGENFRLSYVFDTQDVDKFRLGDIPQGLQVVSGPYTSRSSSVQFVNGHTTTSSSVTYTYTLYAAEKGTYTIPAAKAEVSGKTVTAKTAQVKVADTGAQGNSGGSSSGGSSSTQRRGAPRMHSDDDFTTTPVTKGNDLFIRVTANKKHVYEQEPILLTYKVYSQVDLTALSGKMPDLTGFHTQEIPLPQQKSFTIENIDGKQYRTVVWSEYVMYPQMTGTLDIPSITFEGTVVQRNRNIDPFEAFFNGGAAYTEVHRDVVAPGVSIQVDPLPTRPDGFSGAVGQFTISSAIDKTEVKAGEPITIRLTVNGTGNLKLIRQPTLTLPKDFDAYDPKTTDKTSLTTAGLTGAMEYEYLLVPRNQGHYTIPPVEFIYFDLNDKEYKTLTTEPYELTVLKGDGKTVVADFSTANDNDIHPIHTGNSSVTPKDRYLLGSTGYLLAILLPLLLFIIIAIIFRKQAIDNANIVRMKGKKANKVATKRLKTAKKLMAQGKEEPFYDEVLRALWGYVGDKLNIAVAQLSRENIAGEFAQHNVDDTIATSFIEAIDECEYARYAPGEKQGKMDAVYDKALNAITTIDEMLTYKKKSSKTIAILLVLLLATIPIHSETITKQMADAEYDKGNYQEAIRQYTLLLDDNVSPDLYYNLGNAYYRTENITQAILAYERALKLAPADKDILFNLQFARARTADKLTPDNEAFIITWYKSLLSICTANTWTVISIIAFLVMLLMLLAYLFAPLRWLVRTGFYTAVIAAVIFVITTLFAYQLRRQLSSHNGAIITATEVVVKKTPADNSETAMTLHEGTHVEIIDRNVAQWRQIRLSDGRQGWILANTIEEI